MNKIYIYTMQTMKLVKKIFSRAMNLIQQYYIP